MVLTVLGISGSPVPNSNTDRAVKAVLKATGLEHEFLKLSDLHIRPCLACKRCVNDNVCKEEDDFGWVSQRIIDADALVIGAYTPYGSIDGFTKSFLERLWSLRHVNNLLKGKPVIIVVSRLYPKILENPVLRVTGLSGLLQSLLLPSYKVSNMLASELALDRMEIIGRVTIRGNVPCLTCGCGDECEMSGVKTLYGKNAKATTDKCTRVEDQKDVWNKLQSFGNILGNRLTGNANQ